MIEGRFDTGRCSVAPENCQLHVDGALAQLIMTLALLISCLEYCKDLAMRAPTFNFSDDSPLGVWITKMQLWRGG